MKLSDTNLSVQDREWVERELPPGEELLLVCKPATSLWKPGYAYRMLFATLWNGFLFGLLGMLFINHITLEIIIEKPAILLLFLGLLPFYLIGIGLIISPWWERENDRRTVYVLTNRRAIVLRPSMIRRRPTCRRFPLTHNLIKEVREYRKGRGDIVMGYDEHHGSNGTTLMPKGFLHVDNVRELEYRIHQYLPDAPPPTEATGDSTPERPGLGYVPLAVVALLYSAHYLVNQYILQTHSPKPRGEELIALLFIVCISVISIRTIYRWRKACRAYREVSISPEKKS